MSTSIRQRAQENDLRVGTVYNRINRLEWPIDDALEIPTEKTQEESEIIKKAKDAGLLPSLVQRRLATGWTLEKALSLEPGSSDIYRKYEYNGQQLTIAELEQLSGIPKAILSHRINSLHWNIKRAVKTPVKERADRRIKKYNQGWFRIEVTIRDSSNNLIRKLYSADAICPVDSGMLQVKTDENGVLMLECACGFTTALSHQSISNSPVLYAPKQSVV